MDSFLGISFGNTCEYGDEILKLINESLTGLMFHEELTVLEQDKLRHAIERQIVRLDEKIEHFGVWLGNHHKYLFSGFVQPQTVFVWEVEHLIREWELRRFSAEIHLMIEHKLLTPAMLPVALMLFQVYLPKVDGDYIANQIVDHTQESVVNLTALIAGHARTTSELIGKIRSVSMKEDHFVDSVDQILAAHWDSK